MSLYDDDDKKDDLGHPDSAIRLASAVHRFRLPIMDPDRKISFIKSFKTTGSHEKTRKVLRKADDARKALEEALKAKKISHERVTADAKRYIPLINQILLSCKVQPEVARLDERLVFEWVSGVEKEDKVYKNEALMFDFVMAIICEGLGRAGSATENSIAGEFAAASRDYAAAAGIFAFLADDHLPKWIAKGSNVDENKLPSECCVGVASGLRSIFVANGQQMAVATILIKPGIPNYSLVAKLCLGVHEQLDTFISTMRKEAFDNMSKMDKEFFTLMTFQIILFKALSLYFQARSLWDKQDYGIAIAMLGETSNLVRTSTNSATVSYEDGLPDISKNKILSPLQTDLVDFRQHLSKLLKTWELDNSRVYFESVPRIVPAENKLQEGLKMNKQEQYTLEDVEPILLVLPPDEEHNTTASSTMTRSDSDLARELQRQMNKESGVSSNAGISTIKKQKPPADRPPVHYAPPPPPPYTSGGNDDPPPPPYSVVEQTSSRRTIERSDSDIARELQERLNRFGD